MVTKQHSKLPRQVSLSKLKKIVDFYKEQGLIVHVNISTTVLDTLIVVNYSMFLFVEGDMWSSVCCIKTLPACIKSFNIALKQKGFKVENTEILESQFSE